MKNRLLATVLAAVAASASAEPASRPTGAARHCSAPDDPLVAAYRVTLRRPDGVERSFDRRLIREPRRIAHEYDIPGVMVSWVLTANDRLAMTRYFDEARRAIEYEPRDALPGEWQALQNLVDVSAMRIDASVESSSLRNSTALHYDEACGLLVRLEQSGEQGHRVIELVSVSRDARDVTEAFQGRGEYSGTDFADIGDNEADPFIRRMIALGFIEHSASGFYDANGEAMPGHSHGH